MPSAILWASGHPIRNYSVCKVPPPSSPVGGPGSRRRGQPSSPSHLRDWRARHPPPPPPARGRIQTESGSQSGARGSGWPLRQADTSLSVTYTLSEERGAGNTSCPLLSSLQPPIGGQDRLLTSLLPAGSAGVCGTLCPASARVSPQALPIAPPTNPIPSPRGSKDHWR